MLRLLANGGNHWWKNNEPHTMKPIYKLLFANALLALAGCATTPDVHSRGDSSTEFTSSESFSETSREKADLVFYLHGKSLEPETVTDWNYLSEPSRFGVKPEEMSAYANRRIFVETYDNQSKRQVWMGWIECSCRGIDPERIQHEIQRIVATFPPRTTTLSRL